MKGVMRMPIFLCYDSIKQRTAYGMEKYNGMSNEFTKRRIKFFSVYSPEELRAHLKEYKDENSSIVFFPNTEAQRDFYFERYSEFNINKIVFSNHNVQTATSNYSSVTSDFRGDMELALSHLKEKGCKKIALFNIDAIGNHDKTRVETYKRFIYHEPLIFYAAERLSQVLFQLFECKECIDAIICNNDYTAFHLMRVLNALDENWTEKVLVLSFSNTVLASISTPSLSSISLNYPSAGEKIAAIHTFINKNDQVAYMHLVMKNYLFARESTKFNNPAGIVFSEQKKFSEEEFAELFSSHSKCMPLEKILLSCNITGLKIIHSLMLSKSITEISNSLYLSNESIKYHIKKYKDSLGFKKTAELSSFFREWIDPDKLKDVIIKNDSFKSSRR